MVDWVTATCVDAGSDMLFAGSACDADAVVGWVDADDDAG